MIVSALEFEAQEASCCVHYVISCAVRLPWSCGAELFSVLLLEMLLGGPTVGPSIDTVKRVYTVNRLCNGSTRSKAF